MRRFIVCLLLVASGLILAGCTKNINYTRLSIDGKEYQLEEVRTETERAKGLSGRESLDESLGMIFYFDKPDYLQFWMKDTLIPLQILFIDNCTIVDITEMTVEKDPSKPEMIYKSRVKADRAIELNKDTISENSVGSEIKELCK